MQEPQRTNTANNFICILKIKIDFAEQKAVLTISELANSFNKSLKNSIIHISAAVLTVDHHISLYYRD
jgi:hypothetical protein